MKICYAPPDTCNTAPGYDKVKLRLAMKYAEIFKNTIGLEFATGCVLLECETGMYYVNDDWYKAAEKSIKTGVDEVRAAYEKPERKFEYLPDAVY